MRSDFTWVNLIDCYLQGILHSLILSSVWGGFFVWFWSLGRHVQAFLAVDKGGQAVLTRKYIGDKVLTYYATIAK